MAWSAPASQLPLMVQEALRRGGGTGFVGQSMVGLLLCLLTTAPLTTLSRKAMSLVAVLLTTLFAVLQRMLRDRRYGIGAPAHKRLVLEDSNGLRHEVHMRLCSHAPACTGTQAQMHADAHVCARMHMHLPTRVLSRTQCAHGASE
jgi:hypothetical protein